MPNPIQVERNYQEMLIHFESSLSVRHRYQLFRDFMENLEGSFRRYESYIIQIVEILPEFEGPLTWSGIDPEEIEMNLALLDELEKSLKLSSKSENFHRIQNQLGEICLLLYAFLNEKNGVDYYLKKLFGMQGLKQSDMGIDSQILNLLAEKFSNELNKKDTPTKGNPDRLHRMIRYINEIQNPEPWKVLIPVAEIYVKDESERDEYGRLRRIFVDRYNETEEHDELIWNTNIYGASNPTFGQKKRPLKAARNLFESATQQKKKTYYRCGIHFDQSSAIHDGESANLAIAALWYTRLLEASEQKERFYINSRAAITGNVDKEGNVNPVDNESIELKTRAAFFSWANFLVVPSEQKDLFEKAYRVLFDKYPGRHLNLIGVSHLRELFFDRRVTSHSVESRLTSYFNKVRIQKKSLVNIPLIILLMGIIAWLVYSPVDQNPVNAEFEGEHMILTNQFGQEIGSLEVGAMVVRDKETAAGGNRITKVDFKDLNDDGINEVFYAKNLNTQNQSREEELVAYSFSGDSLIWEKLLRFDLHFPNKPNIGDDGYRIFDIDFLNDTEQAQSFLILSVAHNKFFPGLILKINPETGEESGRYIHTGIVYQIITHDVNGDKTDEIIGLGVNNAFDQATVAFLLNPNEMNGYSPLNEEYKLNGYQKANEVQYVQLPRSIVGEAFRRRYLNNSPRYLQIDEDEETILVRVYDLMIRNPSPFEEDSAGLFFYFNYDFELQSIGTDSSYDLWAKNLYEDGLIPFEPDHKYFEAFKDSLLYWNENKFVYRDDLK